ncbi:MAG: dockerin type I repeat-containing protein [Oscillospiraceae bacterium]|nr:dockerin type I repeat-containing protein [Oscillospiraceae bacterium]
MRKAKVLISLLCSVACLLAATFVPSANTRAIAAAYSETLTAIYPSDFGIEDGVKLDTVTSTAVGYSSLANTVFTADIKHTGAEIWLMYAAPSTWEGLRFGFNNGALVFMDTWGKVGAPITFSSDIAGVKFSDELFRLQISIEPCNSDSDGLTDDVKVGIFFNYKLYNNQYIYIPDILNLLGTSINAITRPYGGTDFGYWEIYSPKTEIGVDVLNITPADFGFADGSVNSSADINMDIANKLLSANLSLPNTDDYFDFAGLKLSANESGELILSDATGNDSFDGDVVRPSTSDLTAITTTDIGIATDTYVGKHPAFSAGGAYAGADTLNGVCFSAQITPSNLDPYNNPTTPNHLDFRQAGTVGSPWESLITHVCSDKIVLISAFDGKIYLSIDISDIDGLSSFNETFTYGISIRYCDFDGDNDNNDVQVGIWINGNLAKNEYAYIPDTASRLGNTWYIYIEDTESTVAFAPASVDLDFGTENSNSVSAKDNFNLEIVTNTKDYNTDSKADLNADIYVNDTLWRSVLIYDYKAKITNKFNIKATVKSDKKQISYRAEVNGFDDFKFTSDNAFDTYNLSGGKVFSSDITLSDTSAQLGFTLAESGAPLTFSDFGIEKGTYSSTNKVSGSISDTLNQKCFSGKFKFVTGASFYFAGTAADKGILFSINASGLNIRNASGNSVTKITAAQAGLVSFNSVNFTLGLSTFVTDTDSDGASDDVKLGIWFNGVYYNSFDIVNGASSLGNYISLSSNSSTNGIAVESYVADFGSENLPFSTVGNDIQSINITSNGTNPVISGLFSKTLDSISSNSKFALDIYTKIVNLDNDAENDLSVMVCINGEPIDNRVFFIKDALSGTSSIVGLKLTKKNLVVGNRLPEDSLTPDVYNLHEGNFMLYAHGKAVINRVDGFEAGYKISTPGEYVIVRNFRGEEYVQKVHLWKAGYVNADNNIDILDFIAAKKHIAGLDDAEYKAKGADTDFDGEVTSSDIIKIKRMVLGLSSTPVFTDFDEYSPLGEYTMPIAGFHGPQQQYNYIENVNGAYKSYLTNNLVTDKVYEYIADAGVNMISYIENSGFGGNLYKNLELAEKYGVGLTVNYKNTSVTDENFAKYVGSVAHFKSFKGFFIVDEPHTVKFPVNMTDENMTSNAAAAVMANKYTNIFGYTNLYPLYYTLSGSTVFEEENAIYNEYLEEYCETFSPKMISWDNYVFQTGQYDYYFNNIRLVKAAAAKYNIPFWGFVQAGDPDGKRGGVNHITEGQLKWNVNTQLAYGVKGMQYFTVVQPYFLAFEPAVSETDFDFDSIGLVGANGEKTRYHAMAKAANAQIAAVDEYLMKADSKAVVVYGKTATADTGETLSSYGALTSVSSTSSTNGAIVGCFEYRGKQAFYAVNYDMSRSRTITLNFDNTYNLQAISSTVNTTSTASKYSATLGAGEAVLVILN